MELLNYTEQKYLGSIVSRSIWEPGCSLLWPGTEESKKVTEKCRHAFVTSQERPGRNGTDPSTGYLPSYSYHELENMDGVETSRTVASRASPVGGTQGLQRHR